MTRAACLLFLLGFSVASAQPPDTLWTRVYDNAGFRDFADGEASQTHDNCYLIPGYHTQDSLSFCTVRKISSDGDLVWETTLDPTESMVVAAVHELATHEIALLSNIQNPSEESTSYLMIFLSADGDSLRSFEIGAASTYYWPTNFSLTSDGGFVISGSFRPAHTSRQDGLVVRTDANGEIVWQQVFSAGYSPFWDVESTSDGGAILVGSWTDTVTFDTQIRALKLDAAGAPQFDFKYGDTTSVNEGFAVAKTLDGGYLVGGMSYDMSTGYDFTVIQLDSDGIQQWANTFHHLGQVIIPDYELPWTLAGLPDGGALMIGTAETLLGGEYCSVLARFTSEGEIDWQECYQRGKQSRGGIVTDDGYVVLQGWTGFVSETEIYVQKLDRVFIPVDDAEAPPVPYDFAATTYPNPFNSVARVQFDLPIASNVKAAIYNTLGQRAVLLTDQFYSAGRHQLLFDGSGLTSGVYFIGLSAGPHKETLKTILLK